MNDVNELTEFSNSHISSAHDSCIPIRQVRRHRVHNTWFNDERRTAIVERELAYKDWKISSVEWKGSKKLIFCRLRNRVTFLIRRSKQHSMDNLIAS